MYREIFPEKAHQNAKVTIEVGDYKVTIHGQLAPPEIESYSTREDIVNMPADVYKRIQLSVVPRLDVLLERVRWEIPIAIRPRIEK